VTLFVVTTPIGNLEDLSPRALRVLKEADAVACEDTRHTAGLLQRFALRKPLLRYDDHVHRREAPRLLERLRRGQNIALVTDAGTPGVSDPGGRLVAEAVAAGVSVVPVPGPSAPLALLAASGFPAHEFAFLGFLPRKPGPLRRALRDGGEGRTVVFLESVQRLRPALEGVRDVFGDAPVVVGRELTKVHEEFLRGTAASLLEALAARTDLKGESVVAVAPQLIERDGDKGVNGGF
jgi:16S rRNA (cytidine1402-2'-O)-methyltransferase